MNVNSLKPLFLAPVPGYIEEACSIPCPSDCKLSEWSNWSRCSKSCGSGVKVRSKWLREKRYNGGRPCPKLDQINQVPKNMIWWSFDFQEAASHKWNGAEKLVQIMFLTETGSETWTLHCLVLILQRKGVWNETKLRARSGRFTTAPDGPFGSLWTRATPMLLYLCYQMHEGVSGLD